MEIPYQNLNKETLTKVIESYVMREGTDYGDFSYSLADKVRQVKSQLESGKAILTFDPETESCDIVPKGGF